ncbi:sn-glycerol-3-phosphate ABC transporter ATP-binding protein UgpC [Pseudonocardia nematodicida]|uniref:Sn-glycerol-3-phosphate ABC transporter ATP-binding protein UgpC n=1 Tax=Pseudonocardia nematodicida TaxID=1206997 RepID=A0ABV1KH41_9PSEU
MAEVVYESASRVYPGSPPVRAVDTLELEIPDGEFLVMVGPSGSGKSTALRMLAGLEDVDEGGIRIGDRDVTDLAPKDRDIAMVFQNYALYPHMTVAQNMGFALKIQGAPKAEIRSKVETAAQLLDLTPYLERRPRALSGGQRQRVAMGRAIVREPSVFLMDEPLSNLDAKLRVETRASITALQQRLGTTTVYVTHDQVEAMTMGTRVAVLRDGVLQQCASPRELYTRPANAFVAGFIGSPSMNLHVSRLTSDGVTVAGYTLPVPRGLGRSSGAEITVGIRPEHLRPVDGPAIPLTVELCEELGSDSYVYGRIPHRAPDDGFSHEVDGGALGDDGGTQRVVLRTGSGVSPRVGETIQIAPVSPDRIHLFDTATGARLTD